MPLHIKVERISSSAEALTAVSDLVSGLRRCSARARILLCILRRTSLVLELTEPAASLL